MSARVCETSRLSNSSWIGDVFLQRLRQSVQSRSQQELVLPQKKPEGAPILTPAVYQGRFTVPESTGAPLPDTFLLMAGWYKVRVGSKVMAIMCNNPESVYRLFVDTSAYQTRNLDDHPVFVSLAGPSFPEWVQPRQILASTGTTSDTVCAKLHYPSPSWDQCANYGRARLCSL